VVTRPGRVEPLDHRSKEVELLGVRCDRSPDRRPDAVDQLASGQTGDMGENLGPEFEIRGSVGQPRPQGLRLDLHDVEQIGPGLEQPIDRAGVADADAEDGRIT
jgi:hypothetical protein